MGEIFGFTFEIVFLALGIYLYLYAIGKIKNKTAEGEKKAIAWRAQNGGWLRIAALALTAISLVNLVLHVLEYFNS